MNAPAVLAQTSIPRLGFLGVGWIGRHRMDALAANGAAAIAAIADTAADRLHAAHAAVPSALACTSEDDLLECGVDGIVIATPSALHADQAIRALERGIAVFSQKPLARTAPETRRVIDAARAADRLLGVDLSYRHSAAMRAVRGVVRSGDIGDVFAVDLVFHNAYGPDSGWARDPGLAGGGCVIDLGVHLIDLAWWVLDTPAVERVTSSLYAHGRRLGPGADVCEDHAVSTIVLRDGTAVQLACSWESSTGRDAVIEVTFRGSAGAVTMRNVAGSFFDFVAEQYHGTAVHTLTTPPDDWPARALIAWAEQLGRSPRYDAAIEAAMPVAEIIDAVLGR